MCGHTFLYSPPVSAVKELLDDGELGEIYFVSSSRVNLGLHQRDVSVIWDLGPHDFSILLYWLDEMPESGPRGRARLDRARDPRRRLRDAQLPLGDRRQRRAELARAEQAAAHGGRRQREDGRLRRRDRRAGRVFDHGVVYEDPETFGEYHLSYRTGDIVSPKVDTHEPLALELADFVEALSDGRLDDAGNVRARARTSCG